MMERHEIFHINAIKAAWRCLYQPNGHTPSKEYCKHMEPKGSDPPQAVPNCNAVGSQLNPEIASTTNPLVACAPIMDGFDWFMTQWMNQIRVPFVHGISVADPDVTLTGLGKSVYLTLRSNFLNFLQLSLGVSMHELPHVQPDIVLLNATNFSHTIAYFFPSYADFATHLRNETYTNKKIIQKKKRELTLSSARFDLSYAQNLFQKTITSNLSFSSSPIYEGIGPAGKCIPWQGLRLFSLDIEVYEFDHRLITEIGFSIGEMFPYSATDPTRSSTYPLTPSEDSDCGPSPLENGTDSIPCGFEKWFPLNKEHPELAPLLRVRSWHLKTLENLMLRNGTRVADAKELFIGDSVILPLEQCLTILSNMIAQANILVGHAIVADIQFLRRSRLRLPIQTLKDLEQGSSQGIPFVDTQNLYKGIADTLDCVRLSRLLDSLGVQYELSHLHNAGNDAFYTLLAFFHMVAPTSFNTTFPNCPPAP
jgi:hypothetical protein